MKPRKIMVKSLDDFISTWCEQKALLAELMSWRERMQIELDGRIDVLQKVSYRNNSAFFQNTVVTQALSELHNNDVLVPFYKASGNVAIICRRFYALRLLKTLGLDRDTRNIPRTPRNNKKHRKPVIMFKKIYVLLSILKISIII